MQLDVDKLIVFAVQIDRSRFKDLVPESQEASRIDRSRLAASAKDKVQPS